MSTANSTGASTVENRKLSKNRKCLCCASASGVRTARSRSRFTHFMMAEGGGPESGNATDSDLEPVAAQIPTPSTECQKQTIGTLLKTTLRRGDEW